MKVVIIKYNSGNIRSVQFALNRIGVDGTVSDDPEIIMAADKVIFPGVGEAGSAMAYLRERKLDLTIKELRQPVLGICLGLQLLCRHSQEANTDCLGIFDLEVKKFSGKLKFPQIGWNNIRQLKSPLFAGVEENTFMYFVHGYFAEIGTNTIATTDYAGDYSSALQKNNFHAVQFHPEKSALPGQKVLENFMKL